MLAFTVFVSFVAVTEPAPYDLLWMLLLPLALITRNYLNIVLLPVTAAFFAFVLAGFFSLAPFLHDLDAVIYQVVTLYLFVTFLLFAIFFSERSVERLELCLRAYAAGCFVASCYGLAGFFNIAGLAEHATMHQGRVSSSFNDPNVFGSQMVPGAAYLLAGILLGRFKRTLLAGLAFGTIVCGVILSMSRGSIAGMILVSLLIWTSCYLISERKRKSRILLAGLSVISVAVIGLIGVLALDEARELLLSRLTLFQDYDVGSGGRFDNQARAISIIPTVPAGMGPLQFAKVFHLDPHSTFVGSFISYGWLGGFAWLSIVGVTCVAGAQVMVANSPYRIYAIVVAPCVLVYFLQAFQIDVEHWRALYFSMGALWGLIVAQNRWSRISERGAIRPLPEITAGSSLVPI